MRATLARQQGSDALNQARRPATPWLFLTGGLSIFRVTTEALRNVAQHSRCEIVHISVHEDHEGIHLVVADDGVGFSVRTDVLADAQDRFGLASMRQHVEMNDGCFEISSSPEHGTVLSAHFATARKAA